MWSTTVYLTALRASINGTQAATAGAPRASSCCEGTDVGCQCMERKNWRNNGYESDEQRCRKSNRPETKYPNQTLRNDQHAPLPPHEIALRESDLGLLFCVDDLNILFLLFSYFSIAIVTPPKQFQVSAAEQMNFLSVTPEHHMSHQFRLDLTSRKITTYHPTSSKHEKIMSRKSTL